MGETLGVVGVVGDVDAEDVVEAMHAGHPIIAPVYTQDVGTGEMDLASGLGHFMLVVGVSPTEIIANDPEMRDAHRDAREVLGPLFDFLDEKLTTGTEGIPGLDDLAVASVFRTRRVTPGLAAVRDFIANEYQMAPPQDLARIPWIVREHCTHVEGTFILPEFQEGPKPFLTGGGFVFDVAGEPVVQREDEARFALSVPKGRMPETGWPVVLYGHGTGGSYLSFVGKDVDERLGEVGIAVLSTDEPLHGPRDPDPSSTPSVTPYRFFNFINLTAMIDNHRQSAADKVSLLRLARLLDVPAEASPTGEPIRLDGSRAAYMGHSLGGITGTLFLAVEPGVGAAVLSGTGGRFGLAFLDLPDEYDWAIAAVQNILGLSEGEVLDEFHPIITLLQTYAEPADPLCYSHAFIEDPPRGIPKNIFLSEGMEDLNVAPRTTEALAVGFGLPQARPVHRTVEGLALRGLDPVDLPAEGNLAFEGTRSTGALIQYDPGDHWALFATEERERQYVGFLASYVETGLARIESGESSQTSASWFRESRGAPAAGR